MYLSFVENLKENHGENIKKYFIIGTANFGSKYGLSSRNSIPSKRDILSILQFGASKENVLFDTSGAYGKSEEFFGNTKKIDFQEKIITKIVLRGQETAREIIELVSKAKEKTKVNAFHSVLIHNPEIILDRKNSEILKGMIECKEIGLTRNIGASCYSAKEIIEIQGVNENLSIFQTQSNVASRQDFENSSLNRLSEQGKTLFVRSIFLQGILLNELDWIPVELGEARDVISQIFEFCQNENISKLKYCLDYVRSIAWSSGVIAGVQSYANLLEIFEEWEKPITSKYFTTPVLDEFLSDPRNWLKLLGK